MTKKVISIIQQGGGEELRKEYEKKLRKEHGE
jgi:hypothetical protein